MPEWKDRRQDGIRAESLTRLRTLLGDFVSTESQDNVAHANLGLYGLGARRTLQQLKDFAEIDWIHGKENSGVRIVVEISQIFRCACRLSNRIQHDHGVERYLLIFRYPMNYTFS
jgi:hypothetical protein